MEDNNSILHDFGIGRLPWALICFFTVMIFLSPIFVTIQTLRMGYNYWYKGVPVWKEKAIEEDSEFVRKPKAKTAEEEKKEDVKQGKQTKKSDEISGKPKTE